MALGTGCGRCEKCIKFIDPFREHGVVISDRAIFPKGTWTPLSDSQPIIGQKVDVYHPTNGRKIDVEWDGFKFTQEADCNNGNPCWRSMPIYWIGCTHWMPTPEKP